MRIVRDRRSGPQLRLRIGAALLIGLAASPAPAGAQTVPQDGVIVPGPATSPSGRADKPAGGMSRGVIVPKGGVDPGMTTTAPRLPPQSMPVIHPQQNRPNDGTVIVPK